VTITLKEKENYRYLIQRYEEKLLRYIVRLSGARTEDAEDILQNVFIKTYKNLEEFDVNLKFSSWIYRIAHNETVTYLRKYRSRPKIINSEANETVLGLLPSNIYIEDDFDNKYNSKLVFEKINRLNEKYRDVLILKYMEDRDYREISDILKKSPGTVATLLKRGKEKLKEEIQKSNYQF
jgi:RNA polymerase sigma-70 factor (ECF subfamily)